MRKNDIKILLDLFLSFAKVGSLGFGGGYSMLPLLRKEITERKGWASEEELADCYALSQCMPGAISVNAAAFIGKKQKGVLGACAAAFGLVFPPVVIITAIAALLNNYSPISAVRSAFAGVRVCVCILILNTLIGLFKNSVRDAPAFAIFLAVLAGAVFLPVSPVWFVPGAAAAGVMIKYTEARKK